MKTARTFLACAAALCVAAWVGPSVARAGDAAPDGHPPGFSLVPAGVHRPLFRTADEPKEVVVDAFLLGTAPVTRAEFLEFVRANPRWRRSNVKRLFADEGYLADWAGDLDLGPDPLAGSRPATRVSWFAAKAYAAWKGCRLPTTAEWERAAAVGITEEDGTRDREFQRAVRVWHATPAPDVPGPVRAGRANRLGIHDLHGLVWEWTSDFNSALVTGDARGDTGIERTLFCGAGSAGASDRGDYPAFMRSGMRSALKAPYALPNLGFRCAIDLPKPPTLASP